MAKKARRIVPKSAKWTRKSPSKGFNHPQEDKDLGVEAKAVLFPVFGKSDPSRMRILQSAKPSTVRQSSKLPKTEGDLEEIVIVSKPAPTNFLMNLDGTKRPITSPTTGMFSKFDEIGAPKVIDMTGSYDFSARDNSAKPTQPRVFPT